MFSINKVRQEFNSIQHNVSSIYLDNAATTQPCNAALNAIRTAESNIRGNVHRGIHSATHNTTTAYENARATVQNFIGAQHSSEIIFTKNCTESLNIAIQTWGSTNLTKADTVYISYLEHHSAIVPWLQLQERIGFSLQWIPLTATGEIDTNTLATMCTQAKPRCIAVSGLSNVLGTKADLHTIGAIAKQYNALFMVDAAQLVAHERINVQTIDCDFLTFSGHKLYGPTGIGVLYGKQAILETLPPLLGGGMMIETVTTTGFTPATIPQRFEAGTPPFTQAIGLAASLEWLQTLDWNAFVTHEQSLLQKACNTLQTLPGITVLPTTNSSGCISFYHQQLHAHDIADILSEQHIFVRAGHHCAQPLHEYLHTPATVRLSTGVYTTPQEVQTCLQAIQTITEAHA